VVSNEFAKDWEFLVKKDMSAVAIRLHRGIPQNLRPAEERRTGHPVLFFGLVIAGEVFSTSLVARKKSSGTF
jgi:hypothetical protein